LGLGSVASLAPGVKPLATGMIVRIIN